MRADVIAHADWSVDPRKRWLASARWCENRFVVDSPRPAWREPEFFDALGPALVGFDFPIGLPRSYASRAGISRFVNALPYLSDQFYTIAERPEQISLQRPFYPRVPGGSSHAHLLVGLGIWSMQELLRVCDAQANAAPLFWTLGAGQPGRAAIVGWRDLLAPALRRDAIRIWPFHGELKELVAGGGPIVVEGYPAEAYARLGLGRSFGKQDQGRRAAAGEILIDWADYTGVQLSAALREEIQDGFGADSSGEDRFDAIAGLFGMIDVALGQSPCPEPPPGFIRDVEGWIIGLAYEADQSLGAPARASWDPSGQL